MTRTDSVVVGTLVALLAMLATLIGAPAFQLVAAPTGFSSPSAAPSAPEIEVRPYIEGVLGSPTSVSPLTARTQADRDLVALVFAGLVRNGPNGTLVPDLAERWSLDKSGKTWTVDLREDARWHDGKPVTSDDVVFTIRTLQDPQYAGPSSSSWNEVDVTAHSPHRVSFTLKTPLGGFLQALTQPIAPAHLLEDVPVDELPVDPFGQQPVGAGPFALAELTDTSASLVPVASMLAPEAEGSPPANPGATDSLTTPGPTLRPSRPQPYLSGIEFRYFAEPDELAAAFRGGELDGASGLPPEIASELGKAADARLMRYPGSTLSAVLLNLRPGHPEFATPAIRTAYLAAIDRAALIKSAYSGLAVAATDPIPPTSPMFDPKADPDVPYGRTAAGRALRAAGWLRDDKGWHLGRSKPAIKLEVISPTEEANRGLFLVARSVVKDWTRLGFIATHVVLPPGEFAGERLATGTFQVAVADLRIGLDPDLYPLLASSQTLTGGSNVIGIQDPALDPLLEKARAPGSMAARTAAYSALQRQLGKGRYLLPLAFPNEVVVLRDTLDGPVARQVTDGSDRFWDVLTWRLAVDR
jgi:peptide/nickel transport system substrate-binding protein